MKQFTLLEFNEDHLVLDYPSLEVLGQIDDTYGVSPLSNLYDDDGSAERVNQLVSALGFEYVPLDEWFVDLIGAAIRQQREQQDYFKCDGHTAASLFELALKYAPKLPDADQLREFSFGAGRRASLEYDVIHKAQEYGFIPFLDGSELNHDNAMTEEVFQEALMYLQDYCIADGYALAPREDYPGTYEITADEEE